MAVRSPRMGKVWLAFDRRCECGRICLTNSSRDEIKSLRLQHGTFRVLRAGMKGGTDWTRRKVVNVLQANCIVLNKTVTSVSETGAPNVAYESIRPHLASLTNQRPQLSRSNSSYFTSQPTSSRLWRDAIQCLFTKGGNSQDGL